MKAVVLKGCCKAEELKITDIPLPEVKAGWVLVKIYAAGLNHSEALLRMFEADQDYINTPIVPGIECVGEIADASDSSLAIGDKIIALMGGMGRSFNGSYAEYALLPVSNVFKVETNLDWISLAAIPETYFTAYGSLFEGLLLNAKDTLLIRGATSTVGQASIQLAKAVGATVVAAARSSSSFEKLHATGTDHCIIDDEQISKQKLPVTPNKILELVGPKNTSRLAAYRLKARLCLQHGRFGQCLCRTKVRPNQVHTQRRIPNRILQQLPHTRSNQRHFSPDKRKQHQTSIQPSIYIE